MASSSSFSAIVDTDVLIDIQRQHPAAIAWFDSLDLRSIAIPGYCVMELYQDARNAQERAAVDRFVRPFPNIVWPSEAESSRALNLFRQFHLSHNIGMIDALIAVTSIQYQTELLTFNTKHFDMIPGITIKAPYAR